MTNKAIVANIELGTISFKGLMLPDGHYAIAVPQIAEIFGTPKNTMSRDLKRLLGEGFRPSKTKTELGNQLINIVLVEDFKTITLRLALKGNKLAQALMEALLEEGIERRFARAFGIRFDEDEADDRLKFRMKRLMARHDWTDVLMERHIEFYGTKPEPIDYKRWTVIVNRKLFDQDHFCCDRDTMAEEQQRLIYDFERMAKRRSQQNPTISPDELVIKALDSF